MQITEKKVFTSTISGKPTKIYAVKYSLDEPVTKGAGKIHYIDILDRSGSMYQVINDVIDHTQKRIKGMNADDRITVIWFSSQGDYKVMFRGATPSAAVAQVLDSIRSVRNLTCFSDAIREAEDAVKDLKSLVDNSVITLLTDGHPVTNNDAAEIATCHRLVTGMKDSILAFNAIGFGNYYNREFLTNLSACSNFGALRHISNIKNFNDAYTDMVAPLQRMVGSKFTVYSPSAPILYISEDGAISTGFNELEMIAQSTNNNTVFMIDPTGISLEPGDEQIVLDLKSFKKAGSKDDDYNMFLYMYADYLFNVSNKRDVALDIIAKNIKDRALADALTNAFSYDEIGEFNTLLQSCIKDDDCARMSGGVCPPKYVPATNAPCVFDVLNILSSGDHVRYIPYPKGNSFVKPYDRIARKTVDEQNAFTPIPAHEVCSPIDLVYASDKLNVSARFEMPGTVAINARAADRVGLDHVWKSKVYRTHTFIKDGHLNIPAACFEVDFDTWTKLTAIKGLVVSEPSLSSYPIATLRLNKIPIINRSYVEKITGQLIADLTLKELALEVDQKVYGYLIDKAYEKVTIAAKQNAFSNCTLNQIDVLKDHGISKANVYGAISPKTNLAADCDFYEIRLISTSVKGFSSLPAVEGALLKPKKTVSEQAIFDSYTKIMTAHAEDFQKLTKDFVLELEATHKNIKLDLLEIRNQMSAIKIATVLNNVWFDGIVIDEKGKATLPNDVTMTVKYGKEYIDVPAPVAVTA